MPMLRSLLAVTLGLFATSALAQITPAGLWRTYSDKDGAVASEARIVDNGGVLSGKIERVLAVTYKPGDKCTKCSDDRKDQPIEGLEFIRGVKKADGEEVWTGGTILDPDNGTVYKVKLTLIEGGKKLEVRGYIGVPMLGRTQTWVRIQ
jgi:uncharacterized protein (DUF2147 family)